MDNTALHQLPELLDRLGLDEEPMGLVYTNTEPADALSPKPGALPTRDREMAGAIDWQAVFGNFTCTLGLIWLARKKKVPAYISAERFGCPGAGFWLGFIKPQTEAIIHYVSGGIPGHMHGELYIDCPDTLRRIFADIDPRPAPARFCVIKPISQFTDDEEPESVIFFARPESLCGLHQLAAFVTQDPDVVASPWSSGCGGIGAWPQRYKLLGQNRAVLGGWDPSARKFYKTDELSFTVPYPMFTDMVRRHGESFLKTDTWTNVRKKIARSRKAWNEDA